MKNSTLVAAAALMGALAASPALAQNAMTSGAMSAGAMGGPNMATYACRPAAAGEKSSAMMGSTSLVCKPIAVQMKGSDGKMHMMGNPKAKAVSGPDTSGLTSMQLNDAYIKWFQEEFSVSPSP